MNLEPFGYLTDFMSPLEILGNCDGAGTYRIQPDTPGDIETVDQVGTLVYTEDYDVP